MEANELRRRFRDFFVERGHTAVPSASLVPNDPTVLFTIAGMVPFKPYFLGDEAPPSPRLTSVQKCFRTVDIDLVGTTGHHLTFFEMLGNFSFGDYFKDEAIPFAWDLLTEELGIDAGRLWVTVHESDAEAEELWRDEVGVDARRVQRMGADNFWSMGDTGPCGPSSEVHFDKRGGEGGGPAGGDEDRYVEIWNLVFMQHNRLEDGSLVDLPRRNIDTGAGLERILPILAGVDSPFETDLLAPLVEVAKSLTGTSRVGDPATDVSLRVLADHARAMTFLVADGVLPGNELRGYVLRRVIRRAVRRAAQLGAGEEVTPRLVEAVVAIMGEAYPELVSGADRISGVVAGEEQRFRQTLRSGSALLEAELERGRERISGETAFRLHDTFGFPIELTAEMAAERGVAVDRRGFDVAMAAQRERARQAAQRRPPGDAGHYRDVLERYGTTTFTGYDELRSSARVLDVRPLAPPDSAVPDSAASDGATTGEAASGEAASEAARAVEVITDRTPFYAEGGGQVGDTGTITTSTGTATVLDTTAALPGLVRHLATVEGEIGPGQDALLSVDVERRDATRRNHTGTHLLHSALRRVLGDHVRQQSSLVAPDRLRFDFNHPAPVSPGELMDVESLVNSAILADEPVRVYETTRGEADRAGAMALFGEKYGDRVRVVEAGGSSVELCGGTHVGSLGMIGPVQIVSESSIGAGTRRIEALTGTGSLERIRHTGQLLGEAARLLRVTSDEVPDALERLLAGRRRAEEELAALQGDQLRDEAAELAVKAEGGVVVTRRDGLDQGRLKELAVAVRDQPGVEVAVLVGSPDGSRVALVAAVRRDGPHVASALIADAARTVGGGGGRDPVLAVAGGRDAGRIEDALAGVRAALSPS